MLSGLSPHWPDGPVAEVGEASYLTLGQIDVAAGLLSSDDMLRECVDPNRAAARYTVAAKKLQCDSSRPVSTLQTVIATRISDV
jgi:hypothetical protein